MRKILFYNPTPHGVSTTNGIPQDAMNHIPTGKMLCHVETPIRIDASILNHHTQYQRDLVPKIVEGYVPTNH